MSTVQMLTSFAKNTGSLAAGVAGALSITSAVHGLMRAAQIGSKMFERRGLPEDQQAGFDIYVRKPKTGTPSFLENVKFASLHGNQSNLSVYAIGTVAFFALSVALNKLCGTPSFAGRVFSYLPVTLNPNVLKAFKM